MNNCEPSHRISALSACALITAFAFVMPVASAQTTATGPAPQSTNNAAPKVEATQAGPELAAPSGQAGTQEEEANSNVPLQVGDATLNLLTWQRSAEIASATARPIQGNIANRSYERYLKSFEHPIPERFNSSVKSTSGSGGK
ncbi:DUF3613 domain-containing protein [Variovorax boronicumulans]